MTSAERKRRITALFHNALARPPEERLKYIKEASAGDAQLFETVSELVAAHEAMETVAPAKCRKENPNFVLQSMSLVDLTERYEKISFIGAGGMGVVYR